MNKAIFLDRDGTINVEKNYLFKVNDFEFLPGAIAAMSILQHAGYKLIIITNQSGIGRGFYTEKDFHILNSWMLETLLERGIVIDRVYYCPHLPDASVEQYRKICDCRKPKLGLFYRAVNEFNLNLAECFSIGDRIRDCAICASTECKGFLIGKSESENTIDKVAKGEMSGLKYTASLYEAAIAIVNNVRNF